MTNTWGTTESDIRDVIFEYLTRVGHWAWRVNQNYRKGQPFFRESKGVADILGFSKEGRFLAIEVKKPNAPMTQEQHDFLASVERRGGIAFIATCLDDVRSREL